ncbi:MAG: hypothetical protein K0S44_1274 [Bacteroidetes bacterium]|nr:hypothetical protein [Bacteroidota bacterium]
MASKKIFLIIVLALASIAGAFTVYSFKGNYTSQLLIFPKGSSYEKEWKKVDSLTNKGLTKSALEVVTGIYNKAKSENNSAQFVKAILHRMKFEQQMEEYSLEKALLRLNEEIAESKFPVKPILHSILAETYWKYYQNNRWKFYNRSTTVNLNNSDITTWDLKTILDQVIKNYQYSLLNSDSSKLTPLKNFDDILLKYDSSRKFRPSLYDFLAHRAVDFFMNEEPDITQPAYKFELNSESYFWNYKDFARLKIESKDTLSLKYYAIKTLQELVAFHAGDKDPKALIDVDLKRLSFVKKKVVSEIKDSLYLNALSDLEKQFSSDPASSDISYKIANVYFEKGNKYQRLQGDDNKWMKKEALSICEKVTKKFPGSDGAKDCEALMARIKEHSLYFLTEKVNQPLAPIRASVTYKNLKTVYVRIAAMDIDKYNRSIDRYYGEELVKQYLKLKTIKQFSVQLPDDGDYQSHVTEIMIPGLNLGHYIILVGSDSSFSYKNNGVSFAATWVSNISYVNRRMENGSYDFYLQHRQSGEPLKGIVAQLYYEKYNYASRKYEYEKSEKFQTDDKGYFNVPPIENYRNFSVDFTWKSGSGPVFLEDRLQTDNSIYQYKNYKEEKKKYPKTFFFLDRAIYRPGQTVYFKGIMINTDGESNEILPNEVSTVTFYDVNSQKISELNLTTNEYGTFNGSFTAPSEVLNGQMMISNGSGMQYLSVEEYKRPKFDVSFKPVEGNYRLGENIKVSGNAIAYSGAKIDGAQVKYRVVRNASFPSWWYWWRGYYPQSAQLEISNGSAISNDTGTFFIDFKAIPDLSIPKSYQPTYTYTVFADVTDINGETHSTQTYISAAYTAVNLNVSLPSMLEKNEGKAFAVYTTNMSGQFQAASGKVEIYRLNQPDKTYRSRIWSQPDKFIMSRQEYEKAFPKDEYKDENNMYKWERSVKVYEKTFENKKILIPQKKDVNDSVKITNLKAWEPGIYVMEAHCRDPYGEDVKDIKYFTVYSDNGGAVPSNQINWFNMITKDPLEPGKKVRFVIGTKEENIKVLFEIEHKGAIVKQEFITLNKEQKTIEIPVEEKHRGNFSFHLMFVKDNRSYVNNATVTVPYTNKDLDIQFETFRNKLLPGQQEEWKIRIRDKKGDKVAAEMMATLYDASLDAFRPNNWYMNIYNSYYSNIYWDANQAFGAVNAQLYAYEWNKYPAGAYKYYDKLNWFGYNAGYYRNYEYDYDGNEYKVMAVSKSSANMQTNTMEEVVVDETEQSKDKRGVKKESGKNAEGDAAFAGTVALADSGVINGEATITGGVAENSRADLSKVAARSNFAETAFFYPQIETDKDGSIIIKFTIPEALTKWKMMGLAHTKDLKYGMIQNELQTQKDLMVVPNVPRFFRENDKMEFSTKISNLSDKDINGTAQLFFYDAVTMKEITETMVVTDKNIKFTGAKKDFTSGKGKSTVLNWDISIPEGVSAIMYKIVAKAGDFSDGEEMAVPLLTNRMLVTETLPLPIRGLETRTYLFEKLITQSNNSTTLRNHKLTLEFTANPAWYAVQALPYLMEYPYECSEQTFSRFHGRIPPILNLYFQIWKRTRN